MAGSHAKRNRRSRNAKARGRRVIGLSSAAGAFLAAAMGPLGTAPQAKADILDLIIDPAIDPIAGASTGATDPLTMLDPSAWDALFTDLANPATGICAV